MEADAESDAAARSILGLPPPPTRLTPQAVRAAWRQAAKICHPEVGTSPCPARTSLAEAATLTLLDTARGPLPPSAVATADTVPSTGLALLRSRFGGPLLAALAVSGAAAAVVAVSARGDARGRAIAADLERAREVPGEAAAAIQAAVVEARSVKRTSGGGG